MNDTENRIMTLDELRDSLRYWQEMLRLQDWRVDARIVRGPHMFAKRGHPGAVNSLVNGQCFIEELNKLVDLKIIDPIDYVDDYKEQDMEEDLVHELLHIHFEPFMPAKDTGREHIAAECAINMIAGALIAQRRELAKLRA